MKLHKVGMKKKIKMEYINNNGDASEAQGVLKRTLKEQDVCQ